jgi:hypothetical protein
MASSKVLAAIGPSWKSAFSTGRPPALLGLLTLDNLLRCGPKVKVSLRPL